MEERPRPSQRHALARSRAGRPGGSRALPPPPTVRSSPQQAGAGPPGRRSLPGPHDPGGPHENPATPRSHRPRDPTGRPRRARWRRPMPPKPAAARRAPSARHLSPTDRSAPPRLVCPRRTLRRSDRRRTTRDAAGPVFLAAPHRVPWDSRRPAAPTTARRTGSPPSPGRSQLDAPCATPHLPTKALVCRSRPLSAQRSDRGRTGRQLTCRVTCVRTGPLPTALGPAAPPSHAWWVADGASRGPTPASEGRPGPHRRWATLRARTTASSTPRHAAQPFSLDRSHAHPQRDGDAILTVAPTRTRRGRSRPGAGAAHAPTDPRRTST
jgi:hypothetical protein